ncbi:hypothetical protein LUX33_11710 [Actinomadura madurae]|nr:hypothetical protein [Actinomadura madurae]MCP9949012.1 hypothetical protein [Actinomadura madurae]
MLAFGGSTAMLAAFTFLTGCGGSGTNASAAIPDSARQKAQAIVTPLIGKPSEFPITEKLAAPVPAGTRIAYVDNGNALVSLMYKLMQPAAKELGVTLYAVRAGTSASGVQSAFSTVVQQRPAAVINTAIDPALWDNQRKQLVAAGIPVVSLGTVAGPDSRLIQPNGAAAFEKQGGCRPPIWSPTTTRRSTRCCMCTTSSPMEPPSGAASRPSSKSCVQPAPPGSCKSRSPRSATRPPNAS